ncbi:unnamed protein product [Mesocestoides corti]|uniref:COX assembly mitochondrial protein n=1 Tax=Mesocestoides corti TaxID=53468 RepID=A0A0R3U4U9_MESCO|nr:unnamed protein product [Mesocestoides corti]
MGLFFSKSDALDFTVLPSDHIEGPLGLGHRILLSQPSVCNTFAKTIAQNRGQVLLDINRTSIRAALADCSGKWHWASLALCRRQFDTAMNCNKRYLSDPDFREQMTKRYLELRAIYRSTGLEPKY